MGVDTFHRVEGLVTLVEPCGAGGGGGGVLGACSPRKILKIWCSEMPSESISRVK